jgi:magnesium-transporting ATPase (P-type)
MATLNHDHHGNHVILLKGAPEVVLAHCLHDADGQPLDVASWEERLMEEAAKGRRMIALAWKRLPEPKETLRYEDIDGGFALLGVVGLEDPPRPEAKEAIRECHEAGIRVVMITGDHPVTARAIGGMLGLGADTALTGTEIEQLDDAALGARIAETDVVARAAPEHKLRLVRVLQGQGHIVAMTGDGANDAPALQAADIGVAMGKRGTDAARQASAMVLADDNFATIAAAVRWGRVAYDNIKKALLFVLPTNVAQALVVAIALAVGWSLPISATQILWVNLVTAVTLAIAVAFESPEPAVICFLSYGAYGLALVRELGEDFARTAATHTLVCAEVMYLFNCRRFVASGWSVDVFRGNPALWPVIGVLALLQLAFVYAPPFQRLFRTEALDAFAWIYALVGALAAFAVVEAEKAVLRRMGRSTL